MADDNKLSSVYISEKTWWSLRKKIAQTWPKGKITASYLATLLSISEGAAKSLLTSLRTIGFIDDKGQLSERANRWREDKEYPKVCAEILSEVFPQELHDLFPTFEGIDASQLRGWFKTKLRVGDEAARQRAALYMLLLKADPNDAVSIAARPTSVSKGGSRKTRPTNVIRKTQEHPMPALADKGASLATPIPERALKSGMSLHIDIQIHISPEAKPDQIEKIFESMAKHLDLGK